MKISKENLKLFIEKFNILTKQYNEGKCSKEDYLEFKKQYFSLCYEVLKHSEVDMEEFKKIFGRNTSVATIIDNAKCHLEITCVTEEEFTEKSEELNAVTKRIPLKVFAHNFTQLSSRYAEDNQIYNEYYVGMEYYYKRCLEVLEETRGSYKKLKELEKREGITYRVLVKHAEEYCYKFMSGKELESKLNKIGQIVNKIRENKLKCTPKYIQDSLRNDFFNDLNKAKNKEECIEVYLKHKEDNINTKRYLNTGEIHDYIVLVFYNMSKEKKKNFINRYQKR